MLILANKCSFYKHLEQGITQLINTTLRQSLQRLIRMPLINVAILGVSLQLLAVTVPKTMMEDISTVADESIPTIMLVLGMHLASSQH